MISANLKEISNAVVVNSEAFNWRSANLVEVPVCTGMTLYSGCVYNEHMLQINERISIGDDEFDVSAIRAQGAGGQNVNKVSSAIHLRFDIHASSLPDAVKDRLLATRDQRITADGVIVIKAQNHRTQEKNRSEALARLVELIRSATRLKRKRIPTRPGKAAKARRVDAKKKRGALKQMRSRPIDP